MARLWRILKSDDPLIDGEVVVQGWYRGEEDLLEKWFAGVYRVIVSERLVVSTRRVNQQQCNLHVPLHPAISSFYNLLCDTKLLPSLLDFTRNNSPNCPTMCVCPILLVTMATGLASSEAAIFLAADFSLIKVSESSTDLSTLSLSARESSGIRQRSLRGRDTDDTEIKDDEERKGGTDIVKWAHGLSHKDAKMVRQIAKANSPSYILHKFNVPYEKINGLRAYSKNDPDYMVYLHRLKRYRDKSLTFPSG